MNITCQCAHIVIPVAFPSFSLFCPLCMHGVVKDILKLNHRSLRSQALVCVMNCFVLCFSSRTVGERLITLTKGEGNGENINYYCRSRDFSYTLN